MTDALLTLMRRHGIGEFLYEAGGERVALSLQPATENVIPAPYAGRFRPHPSSGRVRKGDIVGLLAAGPLVRPVTAPEDGQLGPPLVAENALVSYATPLFTFVPETA